MADDDSGGAGAGSGFEAVRKVIRSATDYQTSSGIEPGGAGAGPAADAPRGTGTGPAPPPTDDREHAGDAWYEHRADGVWYSPPQHLRDADSRNGRGNKELEPVRLAGPFAIAAETYNPDTLEHGLWLRWVDLRGIERRQVLCRGESWPARPGLGARP